ncbi:response regulator [Paucibacter sp. R3-3]|uniref:Response regulator n=1 Tax=Roseateles agri TaxID=3098619 RepID=A0ABU5DL83_9BURK|nr:response regulator [Paucibacter sp. R3-3]MDY0746904.1 response regulator [Paucibacter sp. R3-3]
MKLLIADDDRETAESLAELLELFLAPLQVVLAFDGVQALEAATAGGSAFDAILTDIEMPRMDGINAALRIKSSLGRATPVLIALTGHVGISKLGAITDAFDHVLVKPVKIDELVHLLRAL